MPYPKNKYRKGYTYFSIGDLLHHLEQGRWVYWNNKVMHSGWIISMTLRTVSGAIRSHIISESINQKDEWYAQEYQRPFPEGVTERKMR